MIFQQMLCNRRIDGRAARQDEEGAKDHPLELDGAACKLAAGSTS